MKYIPRHLSDEIRHKVRIIGNPKEEGLVFKDGIENDCFLNCQKNKRKAIKKNAQIHSFRMEHPELRVPFSIPKSTDRKYIKEGIENLEKAFEWGEKNFNPDNFEESFIREIAGRITPELYNGGIATYRTTGTQITGSSVTPPYPAKLRQKEIPNFEKEMNEQLKCKRLINRIETGIYAHLHIARIHPFVDGNGRTARIVQDVILDNYNLPLPVIESGERNTYYELLDKAVYDWKHKKYSGEIKNGLTKGERSFYTFMAGKINSSLDKLINGISDKI